MYGILILMSNYMQKYLRDSGTITELNSLYKICIQAQSYICNKTFKNNPNFFTAYILNNFILQLYLEAF